MKPSPNHVETKLHPQSDPKQHLVKKMKRTQTAEGWRRSVEKICEKRSEKKGE